MAKGSFLSVKRGKLGDAVGYQVSNSNNGEKQGWRIYQPAVRNPQTDGQMVQRVKLAAVNNLYRDLKDVIRRSFENKKYGDESRRAWLSMALGQQFEGPWITKGTTLGLPILGVPISVGSLQPIATNYTTQDGPVFFFLPFDASIESTATTVQDLTNIFTVSGYQEGDQVTFVMGYVPMRQAFAWKVVSFFLDSSDTTPLYSLFGGPEEGSIEITEGTIGDVDGAYFNLTDVSDTPVDALAVIVSRDGQTAGSHLRSTAYFAMNPTAAANWYSAGAYDIARRSYLKSASANTNWELDPAVEPIEPTSRQAAVTNAGATVYVSLLRFTPTGNHYAVAVANGTEFYVKGKTDSAVVWLCEDGSSQQAPADASNDNTINAVSTTNVGNGFRQWCIDNGISAVYLVTT